MWVELKIVVRSTDLDEFRHVNNAKFVEYLEWGRYEWFDGSDAGAAFLQEGGDALGAVVAQMQVDYLKEARRGDELTIRTGLVEIGNKSMRFSQRIFSGGALICKAEIVGVLFDLSSRRSVACPDALRARLSPLLVSSE